MSVSPAFKYNEHIEYRVGGVYSATHQFSLVNQNIQINKTGRFTAKFPNIWDAYKLPKIKDSKIYDSWIKSPLIFWQNQLHFAIWAASSGCGISKKDHLQHPNPIIRTVFRFHMYYQIRRILKELECPLPNDQIFNPLKNAINKKALEAICSEFGISSQDDFRQQLDHSKGMGAVRYYSKHGLRSKPTKILEMAGDYDPSEGWRVHIPWSGKVGVNDEHWYKIEFLEQYFSKGEVDARMRAIDPKTGSQFDAIGSFILDQSKGFTRAGISRINDSIRVYVWAVLGAQAQVRSSILGKGQAFDAQKQFLANVEDAINSAVDIPSSVERYQSTLQYAKSKVDFIAGLGLYMLPSDLDLCIGTINGFNNLIVVALPDEIGEVKLGQNTKVNDITPLPQETFETPPEDFDTDLLDKPPEPTKLDDQIEDLPDTETPPKLSHDEKKLLLTLSGITVGSFLIWYNK